MNLMQVWDRLTSTRSLDFDERRREYLTKVIDLIVAITSLGLIISSAIGYIYGSIPLDTLVISLITMVVFGGSWWLANLGYWKFAGIFPTIALFFIAVYGNIIGGAGAPAMLLYALAIALVALLQGERYHWIILILVLISYSGLYCLENFGYLHPVRSPQSAFINRIIIADGSFICLAILLWFLASQYRQALHISRENEKTLGERAQELARINQEYAAELSSRIQAETALQESEEKYRHIYENAPFGIFHSTINGKFLDVNPATARLFGYASQEEMITHVNQKGIDKTIYSSLEDRMHILDEVQRRSGWHAFENRYIRKDGRSITVNLRIRLLNRLDGGDGVLEGFYEDITDRLLTEEALRDSEQRFRSFVQQSSESIMLVDEDGMLIEWNSSAEKMTLIPKEDALGKYLWDVQSLLLPEHKQSPIDHEHLRKHRMQMVKSGITPHKQPIESVIKRRDGQTAIISQTIFSIRTDKGYLIGAIGRDVTEDKRLENELRDTYETLQATLEAAPVAIMDLGRNGKVVSIWNPAAEWIFGWKRDEVVGKKAPMFDDSALARVQKQLKLLNPDDIAKGVDLSGQRRDGTTLEYTLYAAPLLEDGRGIRGYIAVCVDISERKRAEQEIRTLNTSLELHVAERTKQLEAALKDLESFSYSVSHDLRQPLRTIDGFSQMLEEEFAPVLDERGRRTIKRIRSGVQRMGTLIEDLLNLSRISRSDMRKKKVDMSALVNMINEELSQVYPGRRVETRIQEGVEAYGDERLLRIAMENILGNAWKFTSKSDETKVEFGTFIQGDGITVYFVRDNGVGFDMAYADKLFGAFQRLHGANEFPGTGIGLTTVQRIIQRHGGRIWAESEIDKGATFYFCL